MTMLLKALKIFILVLIGDVFYTVIYAHLELTKNNSYMGYVAVFCTLSIICVLCILSLFFFRISRNIE